jgi:hypothetical protein
VFSCSSVGMFHLRMLTASKPPIHLRSWMKFRIRVLTKGFEFPYCVLSRSAKTPIYRNMEMLLIRFLESQPPYKNCYMVQNVFHIFYSKQFLKSCAFFGEKKKKKKR